MQKTYTHSTSNTRNITLDVAKGLAMILVVWLHAEGPLFALISRLTVPAFFIVSGYLYNTENSFKKFFIRKVHTLYIPFVFWNVLASLLTAALGLIPYTLLEFVKHIILIFLTVDKDGAVFGGSWFIASLFLISILYKFVDYVLVRRIAYRISDYFANLSDRKKQINLLWVRVYSIVTSVKFVLGIRVVINLIIFAAIADIASYVTLPMRMSRTLVLGFFFAMGVLLKCLLQEDNSVGTYTSKKRSSLQIFVQKPVFKYFMAIVAIGLYISIASTCYTDLGFNIFENRGLYVIEVICGSYVLFIVAELVAKLLPLRKALSYVGMHTIDIVLWQYVFFRLVIILQLYLAGEPVSMVTQIYPTYDSTHGWWIVYTVVGVVTSLVFGELLRRGPWSVLLRKIHVVE